MDATPAKIKVWVIPLCEKTKRYVAKNPIHVIKIVSKSGAIPPNAPSSLFLLLRANKIIKGTKKCVKKSILSLKSPLNS